MDHRRIDSYFVKRKIEAIECARYHLRPTKIELGINGLCMIRVRRKHKNHLDLYHTYVSSHLTENP